MLVPILLKKDLSSSKLEVALKKARPCRNIGSSTKPLFTEFFHRNLALLVIFG